MFKIEYINIMLLTSKRILLFLNFKKFYISQFYHKYSKVFYLIFDNLRYIMIASLLKILEIKVHKVIVFM
jgi:hypothetical protein